MASRVYSIYMITSPSGRSYIGYTKDIPKRWQSHKYSRHPIGSAIRKYLDKMIYQVIAITDNKEHALLLEKYCIAKLGTKIFGYNCTDGGEGVSGIESKMRGRKRPRDLVMRIAESNRGKKRSIEARSRMRNAKLKDIDMGLILFSRFFRGLSYAKIADSIGVSKETVRSRIVNNPALEGVVK